MDNREQIKNYCAAKVRGEGGSVANLVVWLGVMVAARHQQPPPLGNGVGDKRI